MDHITLKGVRTHNLKNFDLKLPHGRLIVVTGVSGSGKSSLAMDTLYAEGQHRYVESLSAYARQFLERVERPDVDSVSGILPAVAIEARNVIQNARSTVGTQTEINDYLRLLFARIGQTICPSCGKPVEEQSAEKAAGTLLISAKGLSAWILFSVSWTKKSYKYRNEFLEDIERQGFIRFFKDGKEYSIDELMAKPHRKLKTSDEKIQVIVDRVIISQEHKKRLIDSIETAYRYGRGECEAAVFDNEGGRRFAKKVSYKLVRFSKAFRCAECARDFKRPSPNMFSFNSPLGACPSCQGFGRVVTIDPNLVIPDEGRSIQEGAIEPWTKPSAAWEFSQLKDFCKRAHIPISKPYGKLTRSQKRLIWEGKEDNDYFSINDFFGYLKKKIYKVHIRIFLARYRAYVPCSLCGGARIKPEGLWVKVCGRDIQELSLMPLSDLARFFDEVRFSREELARAQPLVDEIKSRLRFLNDVGAGYLTLSRLSRTLSGGEAQRIHLASSLGSNLTDTLYVLDEPSVGLHERDNQMMIGILKKLRDLGNTVAVVEHDRQMIEAGDEVVDLGPLAGEDGGKIIYHGPLPRFRANEQSLTAKYLRGELEIKREANRIRFPLKDKKASIKVVGAAQHNLKNIDATFPLNAFSVVTGVSGSGKSSLLFDVLYSNYLRYRGRPVGDVGKVKKLEGLDNIKDIVMVDQSPIGRTPRSNPITYIRAFDEIRKAFASTREAKRRGLTPGHFSFNTGRGRCGACEGQGKIKVEMHFLADIFVECEHCGGTRYKREVLDVHFRGKNIHEILELTVDEAVKHFDGYSRLIERLGLLHEVGLGYLRLGQSATTLSAGEAQRMKLTLELAQRTREKLLYLFDEPTVGLHYHDIKYLMRAFEKLLARGHTIIVIEHNMEVIKCADYVVDLGPEGGDAGGSLLYEGSMLGLTKAEGSYTGRFLKRYITGR